MAPEQRSGQHIRHSISPGVPCPETVMVALMTDGSYLLVGQSPEMPMAFVAPSVNGQRDFPVGGQLISLRADS